VSARPSPGSGFDGDLEAAVRAVIRTRLDRCWRQRPATTYPGAATALFHFTLELVALDEAYRRTMRRTDQSDIYYATVRAGAKPLPLPGPGGGAAWVDELARQARQLHWQAITRAGYGSGSNYYRGPVYHYLPFVRRTLLGPDPAVIAAA
jgi:hypothetical protein